jgi:tRNA(Ile)-lysidine synthetase-like protein
MALLHLLTRIRKRWEPPLKLTVAHFNHGLRPEAAQEEAFVLDAASRLGVPVHTASWQEEERSKSAGVQARARQWRRQECERLLQEERISGRWQTGKGKEGGAVGEREERGDGSEKEGAQGVIATAHHADDSLETWVLKLLRGAHISHLRGMEARAGAYVKPLLHLPKTRLVRFLEREGLAWEEDASNQTEKYKRNKVRLRLLPLMAELAGGEEALKARMEEMAEQSRGLEEWVVRAAREWEARHSAMAPLDVVDAGIELWLGPPVRFPLPSALSSSSLTGSSSAPALSAPSFPSPASPFSASEPLWAPLPRLLQEELLHRLVARASNGAVSLSYAQIRRAMEQLQRDEEEAQGGHKKKLQWRLEMGNGWLLVRQGQVLRLVQEQAHRNPKGNWQQENFPVSLPDAGVECLLPTGWQISASRLSASPSSSSSSAPGWSMVLPHVPMGARLRLRNRQEGDRFHPPWRQSPVKLKDFLRAQNVPLHRRDEVMLIVLLSNGPLGVKEEVIGLHPLGCVAAPSLDSQATNSALEPLAIRLMKV